MSKQNVKRLTDVEKKNSEKNKWTDIQMVIEEYKLIQKFIIKLNLLIF
jgi:hypothetical protein